MNLLALNCLTLLMHSTSAIKHSLLLSSNLQREREGEIVSKRDKMKDSVLKSFAKALLLIYSAWDKRSNYLTNYGSSELFLKGERPLKQIFNQDALGWDRVLEIQPCTSSGIVCIRGTLYTKPVCRFPLNCVQNNHVWRGEFQWSQMFITPCLGTECGGSMHAEHGHMECISGHRVWVNFHQYERQLLHSRLFFIWRTLHFTFSPAEC